MNEREVGFLSGVVFGAALAAPVGFCYGVKGFLMFLEEKHPRIHNELKYRMQTDRVAGYYKYE